MGDTELATIAARQEGLVTRPQARAHLSRKQLTSRLAAGRLVPVRWGIYRFAGCPVTERQPLMAACLAGGPGAVASHRSAAVLWRMPGVLCEQPEITVPWPQWPRLPGVKSHQSTVLPAAHCTTRQGVPVTTPARTLADLSTVLPPEFFRRVVEGCLRHNLVIVRDLRSVHDVLATRGRHGLAPLRTVLERFDAAFKPGGSGEELDFLRVLTEGGLPRPVQQHQVVAGGTVYSLDYAYPDHRIGMEYDSFTYHRMPLDLERAAVRNNALELEGWRMLHFTRGSTKRQIVSDVARARSLRALAPSEGNLRGSEGG